jgi:hypothetical protein
MFSCGHACRGIEPRLRWQRLRSAAGDALRPGGCATQTGKILNYIGVDSEPPHIAPARGPPLWDECDAHIGEGIAPEPDWATDWDGAAQAAPDFEVDQRISW